ncbi:structure-specific endonuclease subunit slx1 [Copidosoma floridanum]|uniref:structure-specific endonuclease subunit slx1 n=1 Tax=Copidosoma floridanum TaxID=29053 RepID=UPI0006C9990E|nr:structure-specific endonuclease subunit slx1 [Copidosoma floridanum]
MSCEPQVVEHFYGVYLLYCKNPKYRGRTYIGYTVNPSRRIKQHNAGKEFGGAWRTSNRGPWVMVLTVHGFPNSTAALRFEWAWQHPELSRRLKHVPKKKTRQKTIDYNLFVLSEMLKVGPWSRLPLTLRWVDDDFGQSHSTQVSPPLHMPIVYGKVVSKKPEGASNKTDESEKAKNRGKENEIDNDAEESVCSICSTWVDKGDRITCIKLSCRLVSHLVCLAESFTGGTGMILPVEGSCPLCHSEVLWGDLIRKKIGCNMHYNGEEDDDESDYGDYSD